MEYSRCACAGGLQYTDELMTDAEGFSVRVKRKVLRSVDKEKSLENVLRKLPCRSSQTWRQLV